MSTFFAKKSSLGYSVPFFQKNNLDGGKSWKNQDI